MTDRPGLVDFAVELVSFDLNLCDRQEKFFWDIQMQKNCNQSWCLSKLVWLVKMAIGLVHASYSMTDFLCSVNGFQCWLCQKSAGSWKLCMQSIISFRRIVKSKKCRHTRVLLKRLYLSDFKGLSYMTYHNQVEIMSKRTNSADQKNCLVKHNLKSLLLSTTPELSNIIWLIWTFVISYKMRADKCFFLLREIKTENWMTSSRACLWTTMKRKQTHR